MGTDLAVGQASISLENRGPWTVIVIDEWPRFSLGQTTALGGGRSPSLNCSGARNNFYTFFAVDSVHEAQQVHGSSLAPTASRSCGYIGVDGLFASRSRTMITMRTADCYPVFVKEAGGYRFGMIHAGWRGTRDLIVKKALDEWFDEPVDVLLGAGIDPDEYEVGDDVIRSIGESIDFSVSAMKDRGFLEASNLNIPKLLLHQAKQASVPINSFNKLPVATHSSGDVPLLSYREDQTEDRMVSWVFRF